MYCVSQSRSTGGTFTSTANVIGKPISNSTIGKWQKEIAFQVAGTQESPIFPELGKTIQKIPLTPSTDFDVLKEQLRAKVAPSLETPEQVASFEDSLTNWTNMYKMLRSEGIVTSEMSTPSEVYELANTITKEMQAKIDAIIESKDKEIEQAKQETKEVMEML